MKTILIAAFAVFFAMPANGQTSQPLSPEAQETLAKIRKSAAEFARLRQENDRQRALQQQLAIEHKAFLEEQARSRAEREAMLADIPRQLKLAAQRRANQRRPLPNPNYSETDAILDAIDRNTEALESLRDR